MCWYPMARWFTLQAHGRYSCMHSTLCCYGETLPSINSFCLKNTKLWQSLSSLIHEIMQGRGVPVVWNRKRYSHTKWYLQHGDNVTMRTLSGLGSVLREGLVLMWKHCMPRENTACITPPSLHWETIIFRMRNLLFQFLISVALQCMRILWSLTVYVKETEKSSMVK